MTLDLETAAIKHITIHTLKDGGKVDMDIRILKKSPVLVDMINVGPIWVEKVNCFFQNTGIDLKDPDCLKDGLDCPQGTQEALEKVSIGYIQFLASCGHLYLTGYG